VEHDTRTRGQGYWTTGHLCGQNNANVNVATLIVPLCSYITVNTKRTAKRSVVSSRYA